MTPLILYVSRWLFLGTGMCFKVLYIPWISYIIIRKYYSRCTVLWGSYSHATVTYSQALGVTKNCQGFFTKNRLASLDFS